jgi:glycosyltransferase involved in cell wall biosynthesis
VRRLAHRQDHIVAVSHETAKDIARFLAVPSSRVTVVHNGLDHSRFSPGERGEAAALAHRHDVHPPFFLYVARLEHPAKNHARLIEAFNRFKTTWPSPWQLVLCGSDWHGAEVIHELARCSPFAADIRLPGFVSDAELPTWYRGAAAMVYPSLFEGFGLPPLEAMACGCPVLASSIGAVNEVCAGAALTANPHDVDDLTRQLLRLAHDEILRNTLRAAGIQRAREFNWDRTASAMVGIYERSARPCQARGTFEELASTTTRSSSCISPDPYAHSPSAAPPHVADVRGR